MHGVIFVQLKKYVDTRVSPDAWRPLLVNAGLPGKLYMAMNTYDDAELVALVTTASAMTNIPAPALLRDFGSFIVPDLLKMYRAFMKPEWRTLDVIEHTESHVHTRVRAMTKGAMPPFLEATRTSAKSVTVHYRSPRKLCAVGEGIIEGIAGHFGERVTMTHDTCMLRGDAECAIAVTAA